MRILPLAFYQDHAPLADRFQLIAGASAVTHGHIRSAVACFLYLEMAKHLRQGLNPAVAYAHLCQQAPAQLAELRISDAEIKQFNRVLSGELASLPESAISSSGYVVHTLEAALWCLLLHESYAATVLAAVNLGEDTDTTGAVAGGLAGVYYGEDLIPEAWLQVLVRRADIEDLAQRAAVRCMSPRRPLPNSYWATPTCSGANTLAT